MSRANLPALRRAGVTDAPALHSLIELSYRGAASLKGWTSEASLLDGPRMPASEVLSLLKDSQCVCHVLEDALVGLIGCCVVSRREGGGEFGKFAVHPDFQNSGHGARLLAAAEDTLARQWGGGQMTMTVIEPRVELLAYYQRRGYRPTGARLPLAQVHDAEGWTQGRDLVLVVMAKDIAARR
jgi:GNAT superfamily N-acetyltransferase